MREFQVSSNEKCLNYLFAKHVVNNIQVKLTTIYEVGETVFKSEARKAESGGMENVTQQFLQSHEGLLKDMGVRLTDKTKASEPTKQEF